jgi:hypothetical protein
MINTTNIYRKLLVSPITLLKQPSTSTIKKHKYAVRGKENEKPTKAKKDTKSNKRYVNFVMIYCL